jgi:hypothetical protein
MLGWLARKLLSLSSALQRTQRLLVWPAPELLLSVQ